MDLTGKWKYSENYGHGKTEGELILEQKGSKLRGKIIFTDYLTDEAPYMIQEFVMGKINDIKIELKATDYDIIYSETHIYYELDEWFGLLLDENTISGISEDVQGILGHFKFERIIAPEIENREVGSR